MKRIRSFLLLFLLFYFSIGYGKDFIISKTDTILLCTAAIADTSVGDSLVNKVNISDFTGDSIVIVKNKKGKKTIAAILAFPLPFGVLGLHRLFLGTRPYMPFAYLGSLGGCFGILPLVDFINILLSDKEKYKGFENNSKVFMWVH